MAARRVHHTRGFRLVRSLVVVSATLSLMLSNLTGIAWATLPGSSFNGLDATLDAGVVAIPDTHCGSGAIDDVVVGGMKLNDIHLEDPPVINPSGNAPGHSDLCTVWLDSEIANGSFLLYLAWSRHASGGSSGAIWEFQQSELACTTTAPDCNPWENRQAGDFLLYYDFNGNSIGDIGIRIFNGTSFGPIHALTAAEGESSVRADRLFGEAVINLTELGILDPNAEECETFAGVIPTSATGNSDSSQYQDVVLTDIQPGITNCGIVVVDKVVAGGDDFGDSFPITLSNGGVIHSEALGAGGSFTVIDLFQNLDYTVSEDVPSGWEISSIVCDDGSSSGTGVDTLTGISVVAGETTSCTVTNTPDLPTITLIKDAVGDNISEDDFQGSVNGSNVDWGASTEVDPGDHTVAEAIAAGSDVQESWFTAGDWSCDNGDSGAAGGATVSVGLGDDVTCEITNTELATTLTLHKVVVDDDGGNLTQDDFQARIDGDPVDWDKAYDVAALVEHTASEDTVPGWTPGNWFGDCAEDGTVTLDPGQDGSCTITNDDDPPSITVLKDVTNDHGGTAEPGDFDLLVGGSSHVHGDTVFVLANSDITVGENGLPGYEQTGISCDDGTSTDGAGDVTLNLLPGEHVTCTIFNDDLPASLTLIKNVVNDNGGDATEDDFQASINGGDVDWGVAVELPAGDHQAAETTLPGYEASDWGGDCAADGSVSLVNGEHLTCTITNDDIAPTVTVIKEVITDNGGNEGPEDFTLLVDGDAVSTGDTVVVDANTDVVVGEEQLPGYVLQSIECDDGTSLTGEDLTVTLNLAPGEDVTCVITNDDLPAAITIVKDVVNDDGGALGAGDFELFLNGDPVSSGDTVEVDSNVEHTVSENANEAYTELNTICVDDDTDEFVAHPVTLNEGQAVTCTITNDDLPADISVVKDATGGVADDGEGNLVAEFDANNGTDETITYSYVVTNTGLVTLVNVTLVDDILGPITLETTTLAPGESTTGTAVHVVSQDDADAGIVVNVALVSGDPVHGGPSVLADDDETVFIVEVLPLVIVVPELPKTGSDTGMLLALSILMMAIGAAALGIGPRFTEMAEISHHLE